MITIKHNDINYFPQMITQNIIYIENMGNMGHKNNDNIEK